MQIADYVDGTVWIALRDNRRVLSGRFHSTNDLSQCIGPCRSESPIHLSRWPLAERGPHPLLMRRGLSYVRGHSELGRVTTRPTRPSDSRHDQLSSSRDPPTVVDRVGASFRYQQSSGTEPWSCCWQSNQEGRRQHASRSDRKSDRSRPAGLAKSAESFVPSSLLPRPFCPFYLFSPPPPPPLLFSILLSLLIPLFLVRYSPPPFLLFPSVWLT